MYATDRHLMLELDFAIFERAGDRSCITWIRCAGQRDMPFAAEQTAGRIHANPTGARQEHFGPSVQVTEVFFRS